MISRLLSTVALWAVVFATIGLFGANGGVLLLAVLAVLAQHELHGLLEKSGLAPWRAAPLAFGFAMVLNAGLDLPCGKYLWLVGALAFVFGALACANNAAALSKLAGSVLAIAYVPGLLQYYAMISRDFGFSCLRGEGVGLAIWVIAVAKFTDVGGYLAGSAIGRHKLAPSISPGKTWEGCAGGLLLASLVGFLAEKFAPAWLPVWLTPARAAWMPLVIGVAAIVSDLSESAIKRRAGAKDSGRAIPGIGGALDLVDSLLLAGPVAFYLFAFVVF